nr:hypothetical protein [Rhodoferax sp.]
MTGTLYLSPNFRWNGRAKAVLRFFGTTARAPFITTLALFYAMFRIFVLLLLVTTNAYSFEFKGVRVGAKSSVAEVQERLGVACGVGHADMQVCNGHVTVAEEPATVNLVLSPTGIVQRISLRLSSDPFEQVAAALAEKYGRPSRILRSAVQNAFGARYQQVEHVWLRSGGLQLEYSKFAGTVDQSEIHFSTKADRDLLSGAKRKRSGDL